MQFFMGKSGALIDKIGRFLYSDKKLRNRKYGLTIDMNLLSRVAEGLAR